MARRRSLILGAAGRDFHNFNVVFRDDADAEVVGFTATQIPKIAGRRYPPSLSGPLYPEGLPIYAEGDLEQLVRDLNVDEVVFAYSDVPYEHVGHLSARANAAGADFRLIGTNATMLDSPVPVVAVTAVRTGCGKSPTSRYVAKTLRDAGHRVVVVRHPMPYGDLAKQAVQRFESIADLEEANCTFEEREEYESHIEAGSVVYAGVDFGAILERAAAECDVLLWDGGNNDFPFFRPSVWIALADPLRPGHESRYYPGETNFRAADVLVANKVDRAAAADVQAVVAAAAAMNPDAEVVLARSVVSVSDPEAVRGKRVLCIEDGPTLTHGEMTYGAAQVAAETFGAAEVVDPRETAVGSLRETYAAYPHIGRALPAMGYYPEQIADLEASVAATDCDLVLVGTPFDLAGRMRVDKPALRVRYEFAPEDDRLKQRILQGVQR